MPVDEAKQLMRDARAARARAARAYADLSQAAVAEALGISHITVKRMERGAKDISMDELWSIADACGVPRAFMVEGFVNEVTELRQDFARRFDDLQDRLGWSVAQAISAGAYDRLGGSDPTTESAHHGAQVD
jgi:transcriptional regulator with XRE-family HTH domain